MVPFLDLIQGNTTAGLKRAMLPLGEKVTKKNDGKTHFPTGVIREGKVYLLKGQGSHMLQAFAESEGIMVIPSDRVEMEAGELVEFHLTV